MPPHILYLLHHHFYHHHFYHHHFYHHHFYHHHHHHQEPVQRLLCLTETCLVERDPASYAIVTMRPLEFIFSIVRDPRDPQLFRIEYSTGHVRSYFTTDRSGWNSMG